MSRLVVFALGGVFGAVALALLAPRWREAFEIDVVREPPRTVVAGRDAAIESASVRTEAPDGRTRALDPSSPEASDAAIVSTPTLPVDDAPGAPASSEPVSTDAAPDDASVAAADAAVTATAPAPQTPAGEQTIAPDPAQATAAVPPAVAAEAKVVEVPPSIPSGLMIPVEGASAATLVDTFTEARGGGSRPHDAIDIMAPTGTPVRAVDDGRVAKLFLSDAGGITIYQFDAAERYAYYYAHLDRYADGLEEGDAVKRGEVIGYVGATGNANPAAPHLHFAIMALGPDKRWWEGTAINPYPILVGATTPDAQVASQ